MKNISRHLMLSTAAFAAAGAAGNGNTKVQTAPPTANRKKPGPRNPPQTSAITSAVPLPEGATTNRGSKSAFDFAGLAVGQSFGVLDRGADKMSSIVSNQNRKKALDANKNPIMVDDPNSPVMDGAGAVIGYNKIEKPMPKYVVRDVDPKTDPDKAKCRVWRLS